MVRRERVVIALKHKEPDRIPWDCSLNYKAYENVKDLLNINTGNKTVFNHKMVAKMELEMMITNRRRLAAERGLDWDEEVEEYAEEMEILRDKRLTDIKQG